MPKISEVYNSIEASIEYYSSEILGSSYFSNKGAPSFEE